MAADNQLATDHTGETPPAGPDPRRPHATTASRPGPGREIDVKVTPSKLVRLVTSVGALAPILFLTIPRVAAAAVEVDSLPPSRVITIDGNTTEWRGLPLAFLGKNLHYLSMTHDRDNLYLMWRFADARLARKVMARGVTIWLNGDGKKKENFGVRYAGSEELAKALSETTPGAGRRRSESSSDGERRFDPDRSPDRPPGRVVSPDGPGGGPPGGFQQPGTLTLFQGQETTVLRQSGGPGLDWASALSDGVYGYELRIPLRLIGGEVAGLEPGQERALRIGIQMGGRSHSERREARRRGESGAHVRLGGMGASIGGGMGRGGMGGGGMGRGEMGGGRMGHGGGPGGGPRGPRRTEQTSLKWLKIQLVAR